MVLKSKLMRQRWYPRPHNFEKGWMHGLETGVVNRATIIPILHYDEGLGSPSTYEANPENASFAEYGGSSCFVGSRVDLILSEFRFELTKAALETDKLHIVRCAFMPIFTSFKEDLIVIDELSSNEIQDVLELQSEATDRQAFPLYNGVKMVEKHTNSALMHADEPGLTSTQVLEGVAFSTGVFYDALHYMTIAGKLKAVQGGLKWFNLTKDKPYRTFFIKLRGKVKRMNPYTQMSVLVVVPQVDNLDQYPIAADTTNVSHVSVTAYNRYNEWHQDFNMKML